MKYYLSGVFLFCFLISGFGIKKEFSFWGLHLGQSMAETTNVIISNKSLKLDRKRFLGLINEAIPFTLKADSYPFIPHIYVQFYSNISYVIIIQFNPSYFDFNMLSERLEDEYGKPILKTSKLEKWQLINTTNSNVIMQLEYPSTLKVIDMLTMIKVNSIITQRMDILTNQTVVQSNRMKILNDL